MSNDRTLETPESKESQRFVVYLRFPFARNGFHDPESCEWSEKKAQELREYLSSRTLKREDMDWEYLANRFQVSEPFILQQAIWLYEKELEHMHRVNRHFHRKTVASSHKPEVSDSSQHHIMSLGSVSQRLQRSTPQSRDTSPDSDINLLRRTLKNRLSKASYTSSEPVSQNLSGQDAGSLRSSRRPLVYDDEDADEESKHSDEDFDAFI